MNQQLGREAKGGLWSPEIFVVEPWGGYSTKFYTGRLCPEVQPLTLLYT